MGFLQKQSGPVIFDEAQYYPELFSYIQDLSDKRNVPGQYILSGSQSFLLNQHISQSLAGRVFVSHLLPFDTVEIQGNIMTGDVENTIFTGFYPRIFDHKIFPIHFYPSYVQTYIERDVRSLKSISNLNTFTRFLGLCAGRIGQVLNISSLANDAGVSVNTAKSWLSILEASFILFRLQPYYRNVNKRLIKSPKIYFYDTGLACSLLKIFSPEMVSTHYLYGSLFENLIIGEIVKYHYHNGKYPSVYYMRDSNGKEIDCIVEKDNAETFAIEIKGGHTFSSDYLKNFKKEIPVHGKLHKMIVYAGNESAEINGVSLLPWESFNEFLVRTIRDD
jgi:predicted AAA+ superfamily ATPase